MLDQQKRIFIFELAIKKIRQAKLNASIITIKKNKLRLKDLQKKQYTRSYFKFMPERENVKKKRLNLIQNQTLTNTNFIVDRKFI